jgi:hypothetical protein
MTNPNRDKDPEITVWTEGYVADPQEAAAMATRPAQLARSRFSGPVAASPDEARAALIRGQFGTGKSSATLAVLTELAHGKHVTVIDPQAGDNNDAWRQRWPTQQADPTAVAAAMAGYRTDQLSLRETKALERGIEPATYRRLNPAVTGKLADQVAVRVAYLAAHIAPEMDDEQIYTSLLRDPRSAGFRLALYEARLNADSEPIRRLAMLTEWVLNSIELGREQSAMEKLVRAEAILG